MKNIDAYHDIIEQIILTRSEGKCFVRFEGAVYQVGETLLFILETLKGHPYNKAVDIIQLELELDQAELALLSEQVVSFFESLRVPGKQKSYLYLKFTLINKRMTNAFARRLIIFFKRNVFLVVTTLLVLINGAFLVSPRPSIAYADHLTVTNIIILYMALLMILIFHEFGHATACLFFGVKPSEIGFGMYIFLPVLYSNVTEIWVLSKMQRIVVNIAGIYFQLILNSILIVLLLGISDRTVNQSIRILIETNTFVMLYSLIPFLRNDGYWIYSDYFEIPDLNKEANIFPLTAIKMFRTRIGKIEYRTVWLGIYSLGNYAFLFFVIQSMYVFSLESIRKLSLIDFSRNFLSVIRENQAHFISVLFVGVFVVMILKSFFSWVSTIRSTMKLTV